MQLLKKSRSDQEKQKPANSPAATSISPVRRWLFRGLAVFVVPLFLLALFESALRVADYGYRTSFFLPRVIGGQARLVENWQFGWRFFPPELARSPTPAVMEAKKPPGVFRIFLFGESAALGDPRPAYGAGRYLETLLRERFPGTDFEVVCVAMTAINSHVLVPIARECARYQGDLWIVYMGNNEYIGPFGPNTVFGPAAISTASVRAFVGLQRLRTGQLLVAAARKLKGNVRPKGGWGGLSMFQQNRIPPDDPRRVQVTTSFGRNLEGIVRAGTRAGVPILLSSMASNLKDCAPFGSVHEPPLDEAERAAWEHDCQIGITNSAAGHWAEAAAAYEKALKVSPRYAELQFRLGECWSELTRIEAAAQSFTMARDEDALPFRADSKLNEAVERVARLHPDAGVGFVDSAKALAQLAVDQIPGQEFFYEHVHLNFAGNYLLARIWAERIIPLLPERIKRDQTAAWADAPVCAQRLGLTDWNRSSILEEVKARLLEAPYTGQVNHASQLKRLTVQLDELKARLPHEDRQAAQAEFETAIRQRPQDHWLHQNFAEFLEATGELAQAESQWQAVAELLPHHHLAYFQAGRLSSRLGQSEAAIRSFKIALSLRPDLAEADLELGKIYAGQHQWSEALAEFDRAEHYRPDDPRVDLVRAEVWTAQGKRVEAMQSLRRALELRPNYWEAHYLRGLVFAAGGNMPGAESEFVYVLRQRPNNVPAHFNLGVALSKQNRIAEARAAFQETLRLEPGHAQARGYLDALDKLDHGRP